MLKSKKSKEEKKERKEKNDYWCKVTEALVRLFGCSRVMAVIFRKHTWKRIFKDKMKSVLFYQFPSQIKPRFSISITTKYCNIVYKKKKKKHYTATLTYCMFNDRGILFVNFYHVYLHVADNIRREYEGGEDNF